VGLTGGPFVIPAEHTIGPAWGIQRGYDIYADNAESLADHISNIYRMAIRKGINYHGEVKRGY
jgi:hypothetical protein